VNTNFGFQKAGQFVERAPTAESLCIPRQLRTPKLVLDPVAVVSSGSLTSSLQHASKLGGAPE